MDIQTSKIELAKMILNIEDPSIINKILDVIKSKEKDFWLELSENEKKEIQLGIDQLDRGERIPFDDFLKKVS